MDEKSIIAREVSWLSFNARVLQEAEDSATPLKKRMRFLGIYSNNRDEFFRKRMAEVKQLIHFNEKRKTGSLTQSARKILSKIFTILLRQQRDFERIWKKIKEDLKKKRVFLLDDRSLNAAQKQYVQEYFEREVSASIIPLFIQEMPQWPSYEDENIFLGIVMKKSKRALHQKFAIIEIPIQTLPRFISLPSLPRTKSIILLEDLIRFNLPKIFFHLGYTCFEAHMFKVTKDAKIDIDDDVSTTFIQKIEKGVKNRRTNHPISFTYDREMNQQLLNFLIDKLNLSHKNILIPGGKIRNFCDFIDFPPLLPNYQSKQVPFKHPALAHATRVSDVILRQDVLLHFPYHSFHSIIELLCEAAIDSSVKSIKVTAYRLADRSKICNALINAARSGKEVHVILELRACFDEYANLKWKQKLEEEGVKVFLGIPHMKVHAKICVIKKQVGLKVIQYGFIGTGNLNEKTALCYTDLFLLTSDRVLMADINRIFKALEDPEKNWFQLSLCKALLVSPVNMREALSKMIQREIKNAKNGLSSRLIINLNSLSDKQLIEKLNQAAQAGVVIEMIIRGVFCAEPQKESLKLSVKAISIVDEYLEHCRLWLFHNGGKEEVYLSSCDWNERNLNHRIEIAAPIKDPSIIAELKHILEIKLSDNVKARKLDKKLCNKYVASVGKKKIRSQSAIYHYLKSYTKGKQ